MIRAFRALISLGLGSKLYVGKNIGEMLLKPARAQLGTIQRVGKEIGSVPKTIEYNIPYGITGALGSEEGDASSDITNALK